MIQILLGLKIHSLPANLTGVFGNVKSVNLPDAGDAAQ
jgi:hypothetical protein